MSGNILKSAANRAGTALMAGVIIAVILFPVFSAVGWAKNFVHIDHRSLQPQTAFVQRAADKESFPPDLFNEGLLSVTFDDGYESIYKEAYPLFQQYGIHTTQYVISGVFSNKDYMSYAQVNDMYLSGHDIACHTVSHPDLTTLSEDQLSKELNGCKNFFAGKGITTRDFASPYGHTDDKSLAMIQSIYRSHRNTNGDITKQNGVSDADVNTAANFNPYNLIGITVRHDTSLDELKSVIDYAQTHKSWVILTYHQIDDENSTFGLNDNNLKKQLQFISQSNIRIATVGDVMSTPAAMRYQK